jgi:hypothetical protein
MWERRRGLWAAAAAAVALTGVGAGVAFAGSGTQSPPSAPQHNSAGCVPRGEGSPVAAPETCGPGNYPLSDFYRNDQGQIALACGDSVFRPGGTTTTIAEGTTTTVAEGEPDPHCHPMSQADMAKSDEMAGKANQGTAPAPAPVPGP